MSEKGFVGALVGIVTAITGSASGGSDTGTQYKQHQESQHAAREEKIDRDTRSESRSGSEKSGQDK